MLKAMTYINKSHAMNQEELLELIEKAAKEGATELDLSGNDLNELPLWIAQVVTL